MRKITPVGLKIILATNLHGIMLFDVIDNMGLATTADGSLKEHVVDNIKTMLKVAMSQQLQSDDPYVGKTRNALKSLLDYGSSEMSEKIKLFLEEAKDLCKVKLLTEKDQKFSPYLFKPSENSEQTRQFSADLSVLLNQIVQSE